MEQTDKRNIYVSYFNKGSKYIPLIKGNKGSLNLISFSVLTL